jgi:hypothetical protein
VSRRASKISCLKNCRKIIDKKEKEGECHPDGAKSDGEKPKEEKEACYANSTNMVKIANLDAKTKSEWKAYWKKLYPSEYVEAMFADK